jgi:CelD/BcsL family acetyltransferase involved in cellulose biosynthesis
MTMPEVASTLTDVGHSVERSRVSVRFAIGDLRLMTLRLSVREVRGHFLEDPITLADLLASHDSRETVATFGRSVVFASASDRDAASASSAHLLSEYNRYFVELHGTFDAYLARFSPRSRSTLLRKVRKFEQCSQGSIDVATFASADTVESFLDEGLALSAKTYQHRLFRSGLSASGEFRERLKALASRAKFRGWLLRLDGRAIAYICSSAVGRTLLYEYVGFDPAYAHLSPGTVLQFAVLKQLFAEQSFRYFDFTEGEGAHKELFATGSRHCADVLLPGRALWPGVALGSHRVFNRCVRVLTSAVDRAGLKPRLKRLLRR